MGRTKENRTMKTLIWDIIVDISWADISKKHFVKIQFTFPKSFPFKNKIIDFQ